MTPLLLPVVPDVKIIVAVSSGAGLSASLSEVLTIFFKFEKFCTFVVFNG